MAYQYCIVIVLMCILSVMAFENVYDVKQNYVWPQPQNYNEDTSSKTVLQIFPNFHFNLESEIKDEAVQTIYDVAVARYTKEVIFQSNNFNIDNTYSNKKYEWNGLPDNLRKLFSWSDEDNKKSKRDGILSTASKKVMSLYTSVTGTIKPKNVNEDENDDGLTYVTVEKMDITINDVTYKNVAYPSTAIESYELHITKDSIKLHAKTIWGVLRGLETFAQLVKDQRDGVNFYIYHTPIEIKDEPRYTWRGLMVDVARHFHPIPLLEKIIDGMEAEKLNTLHLHLADAETFPLEIPEMPITNSYEDSLVYTEENLKYIITYAGLRGIRVVPEIDLPGHAYSWGKGYEGKDITTNCPELLKRTQNINNVPLNIANEETFKVVKEVYNFINRVFPDEYFHVGGDEVFDSCWKEDSSVADYVKTHNMTYDDLQGYFQKDTIQPTLSKNKKRAIAWEELAELGTQVWKYNTSNLIQVWKNNEDIPKFIAKGYKVVVSAGYYLDRQKPVDSAGSRWLWYDTWRDFYEMELDPNHDAHVMGGEACMWSEQTDNQNILSRIFPRISGISERLWSPYDHNHTITHAQTRLMYHRCYSHVKRGVKAGPIRPDYCPYYNAIITEKSWWDDLFKLLVLLSVSAFLIILTLFIACCGVYFAIKSKFKKKSGYVDVNEYENDNQIE